MASIENVPSAFVTGNRIPFQYFLSKGHGQSDAGGGSDPWEASSYDAALAMAGVEDFNMMKYSSILPKQAKEISRTAALKRAEFGSVMEGIYASMNGVKGQRITAALMITRMHDQKGKIVGSFCTEYMGEGSADDAKQALFEDSQNMIKRRGYGTVKLAWKKKVKSKDSKRYFTTTHFIVQSLKVKKKYGSVIAGLFFINYIYPLTHRI